MAVHIKLSDGGQLVVEGEFSEIAAVINSGAGLVAVTSAYGGTIYVNPSHVLFLEQPTELGLGKREEDVEAETPPPEPAAPPSPSQAPPGPGL